MSESESDHEVVEEETVPKADVPPPRKRYQSTKGDNDKRKTTSKANMEKARQAKLAQIKREKELANSQFEILDSDSGSDSSSSEEELVISKVKKSKKKLHTSPVRGSGKAVADSRIDRLEAIMMNLAKTAQKKAKKKVIQKKTIVQLPPYPQQQSLNSSIAEHYKTKLLQL